MRAKEITDCEKVVMKCVWDSPQDLSMQEITEMVNQPLVDKEEYKDDVLKDYVQFWNGGSMSAFVCGLFGKEMLSESERKELKTKINELD